MKTENKYILELCKFKNVKKDTLLSMMNEKIDYPYVLGHLLYNRVGGIAYYTLKEAELLFLVNRELQNTLQSVYESNMEKGESLRRAMLDISEVCHIFSFPYALLKGAYLVDIYPAGLRTSNDIDFLIRPADITKLSNVLRENGFQQGSIENGIFVPADRRKIITSRMNRGETVPFIKQIDYPKMKYLELDVNFSLGFKPGEDESIVSDFLMHTESRLCNGMHTLNSVDFLLHLCAHLYKEATVLKWVEMERDVSLYKYCDLYLFILEFFNVDFAVNAARRAISVGLRQEVYYALYYTRELFQIENTSLNSILEAVKPDELSFMNQIIDPQNKKRYAFHKEYTEWVFCSHRMENLYEIPNPKDFKR